MIMKSGANQRAPEQASHLRVFSEQVSVGISVLECFSAPPARFFFCLHFIAFLKITKVMLCLLLKIQKIINRKEEQKSPLPASTMIFINSVISRLFPHAVMF